MPERPPNIKNLVYESAKQPERMFDPEQDLTSNDWQQMNENLGAMKENGEWVDFEVQAVELNLLGRPPKLAEPDIATIKVESARRIWDSMFDPLGHTKILGKALDPVGPPALSFKRRMNMESRLKSWEKAVRAAAGLAIFDRKAEFDPNDRQEILHWVESRREEMITTGETPEANIFSGAAADLRIIGTPIEITNQDWKTMREALRSWRESGLWRSFSELATYMTILAADEIKIPPGGGLELIWNKKSHDTETPPQPSARKF